MIRRLIRWLVYKWAKRKCRLDGHPDFTPSQKIYLPWFGVEDNGWTEFEVGRRCVRCGAHDVR